MTQYTLEELDEMIADRFGYDFTTPILRGASMTNLLIYVLSVLFVAWHLYWAITFPLPTTKHALLHLSLVFILWGLLRATRADVSTPKGKLKYVGYIAYSLVGGGATGYFFVNYTAITRRYGVYPQTDIVMGAIVLALLFIALLHISKVLTSVASFGIIYAYFGPYFPGFLGHGGLTIERIITMNTAEFSGAFGSFLEISATWIVIYMILAGFIETYGGLSKATKSLIKGVQGYKYLEVGHLAVLTSAFMGSINGSTAANSATTGSFTIPLMKSSNYRPSVAAAIESVASSGGQILPPIMGAGAFIMAQFLDQTYRDIIVAATPIAILYFLTVYVIVYFNTEDNAQIEITDYDGATSETSTLAKLWDYAEYLVMFAILLYYLVYLQAGPMLAGAYAILSIVGLRLLKTLGSAIYTSDGAATPDLLVFVRQSLEGMKQGVENTLDITIMIVALALVVRAFIVTTLAVKLSNNLIILAGGSIVVLLVIAMISSIVFGMGMSTTPAYMVVALLIAPALVTQGVQPLIAHFFVFWFAIASAISPPIAIAIIITSGIAEADFWTTVKEGFKLGYPMFLIPYAIYVHPDIVFIGPRTVPLFLMFAMGFISLGFGLSGRITEDLSWVARGFFIVGGFATLFVPWLSVGLGLAALMALAILNYSNIGPSITREITGIGAD